MVSKAPRIILSLNKLYLQKLEMKVMKPRTAVRTTRMMMKCGAKLMEEQKRMSNEIKVRGGN